jgi:hypothetical protein
MSIRKSIKEFNADNTNINNKNINEKEKKEIGRKRNRQKKIDNEEPCFKCKKQYLVKKKIKYKSKTSFIQDINLYLNNNNNNLSKVLNNQKNNNLNRDLINVEIQISKIICKDCLLNKLRNDNNKSDIFNFIFNNEEETNDNSSLNLENSNLGMDKLEKSNDNREINLNLNITDLDDIIINEYEECLRETVEYMNKVLFEVSCFVKFYNIYSSIDFVNNSAVYSFYIDIFFQIYIQTKYRLNNLYLNGFKIITKCQNKTNNIITKLNIKNNNNINKKRNVFIENTNIILAKLSDFLNYFNICLNFFSCSNNIRSIGQ